MEHDPPIALLVLATFDDKRPIVGNKARSGTLGADELDKVSPRVLVEAISAKTGQHPRLDAAANALGVIALVFVGRIERRSDRTDERAFRPSRFGRPPNAFAMPERQASRTSRCRFHDNAVARDFADAPRARTERDDVAHPRFVDHLLIKLAHAPPARLGIGLGQHNGEHAAIGNGARRGNRLALRAWAGNEQVALAIPDDARREIGKFSGRVRAAQHAEHGIERTARKIGKRSAAAYRRIPLVGRDILHRHRSDRLLSEHIERVF